MRAMSTPLRVVAFVAALATAFAVAWGGGRLVGPIDTEPVAHAGTADHGDEAAAGHGDEAVAGHGDDHGAAASVEDVGGLSARADGYTLSLADRTLDAGRTSLAFQVLTSSGRPLLDYTREHEKDLHLIVVRRDLTGFQHVHPTLDDATGTWSADVRLEPGVWRVVADFTPEGWDSITLADDVAVAGDFAPAVLPADARTATVRTDVGSFTVTSAAPLDPAAVQAAVEEAGYALA